MKEECTLQQRINSVRGAVVETHLTRLREWFEEDRSRTHKVLPSSKVSDELLRELHKRYIVATFRNYGNTFILVCKG